MAKKSNKNENGTSFHGDTILASVYQLTLLLGEPNRCVEEDKVNYEWRCETNDGDVFYIYDWKDGKITKNKQIRFHIGSINKSISLKAEEELLNLLNQ
jgi:hypothetical protein